MKKLARRVAVVVGTAALSIGLIGAVAAPAHAGDDKTVASRDSSWPV